MRPEHTTRDADILQVVEQILRLRVPTEPNQRFDTVGTRRHEPHRCAGRTVTLAVDHDAYGLFEATVADQRMREVGVRVVQLVGRAKLRGDRERTTDLDDAFVERAQIREARAERVEGAAFLDRATDRTRQRECLSTSNHRLVDTRREHQASSLLGHDTGVRDARRVGR